MASLWKTTVAPEDKYPLFYTHIVFKQFQTFFSINTDSGMFFKCCCFSINKLEIGQLDRLLQFQRTQDGRNISGFSLFCRMYDYFTNMLLRCPLLVSKQSFLASFKNLTPNTWLMFILTSVCRFAPFRLIFCFFLVSRTGRLSIKQTSTICKAFRLPLPENLLGGLLSK